jgi:hypothetical protein
MPIAARSATRTILISVGWRAKPGRCDPSTSPAISWTISNWAAAEPAGARPPAMVLVRSHRGVRTLVVLKAAPVASYFVNRCEGAGEGTGNDHLPDRPDPPTSKRRRRGMPSAG